MASVPKKPRHDESNGSASAIEPDGIIRWEIDKMSELTTRWSPVEQIRGIPWRLAARKKPSRSDESLAYFDIHIYANVSSSSPLWKCDFAHNLSLIRKEGFPCHSYYKEDCTTSLNRNGYSGARLCQWNPLMDPNQGFVEDDKAVVEVRIYVKSFTGMACMPSFDFSALCETRSDVALIIEGKPVHVSRQYLALYSDFFQSLFYGNFAENGKKEVKIEDVIYEEFIEMLHVIYPSRKKIKEESFDYLLKLGDRFQVPYLMERVENFLVTSAKISAEEMMEIATKYRLFRLKRHFSPSTTEITSSQEFDNDMDFSDSEDSRSDVALIIEGKKVHLNKQYLGIYSTVFHNLFYGNSADKGKKEFKLDNVAYEEFVNFLLVICNPCKRITVASAEYVLKLAIRYQIPCVIERAEDFLINSNKISIPDKLRIAEKYQLFRLQDHCFSKLKTLHDFKAVKRSPVFRTLSSDTKAALFEQIVEKLK